MKSFPVTIVCGVLLLMGFFFSQGVQSPQQEDNFWPVVSLQTYADSLSSNLLQEAKEMFEQVPYATWKGRVIAKQIVNLQDGGNMTILAVEAYGRAFPCLQLDFDFAVGDSVQMLRIAYQYPGTEQYNNTYLAIPIHSGS